jgi:peptidyl-prolyl cis-trans isomerase B (cyclophilin B)
LGETMRKLDLRRWWVTLVAIACIGLIGCTSPSATSPDATSPAAIETNSPIAQVSPTGSFASLPRLNGAATVELVVKGQPITLQLDGANAPITAGNFVDLVQQGVYTGLAFHRVVREPQPFVVQGGDPQSADPNVPVSQLGTGGFIDPTTSTTRYIPLEIKPENATEPVYSKTLSEAGVSQPPVLKHTRGALAMARAQFPDSASSQFYIALADLPPLDGEYAVFGYVTNGMDIVDQIQQGDRIDAATVVGGLENLQPGA